ncbi:MAG: hypothetical protein ACT6TH_15135 [Brevundimonas sp.]|uniref:hypothetical protein n=1 Tax=Brevundimonas sp. TaxID=1871086 RepID=UPI0040344AAA
MSEQAHTPGPWAWMGGPHGLYLATTHSGRRYVMGFRRMGFNDAQPLFRERERMVPAADLVEFEVGDASVRGFEAAKTNDSVYRYDVVGIDNADARLIAAAPDLLEALQVIVTDCSQIWTAAEFPALAQARAAITRATLPPTSKAGGRG